MNEVVCEGDIVFFVQFGFAEQGKIRRLFDECLEKAIPFLSGNQGVGI